MQLLINGQPVDITLEQEKTVGEVLQSFETEAAANGATTVGINLNGTNVPAESFENILKEPLTDNTVLDLTVITKTETVDTLKAISAELDASEKSLSDIAVLLQSGKEAEAAALITKLATNCDILCHTAAMASLFPEIYKTITIEGQHLNEFFRDFLPVLADFENAMKDKDSVTVGDLAEYEIAPRLKSVTQALSQI